MLIRDVEYSILLADGRSRSGVLPTIELSDVGVPEGKTPAGLGVVVLLSMGREMFMELAAEKLQSRFADLQLEFTMLKIDPVMYLVAKKLDLSDEQLQELRPILHENILALRRIVEEIKDRGFLNLNSLPDKFRVITAQAKDRLKDQLSPEQLAQLDTIFQQIQKTSREEILAALSAKLADFLELHQEQIEQARAILRDEIVQRVELLASLVHDPLLSPDDFMQELNTIQSKTCRRLAPLLNDAGRKRLDERQKQVRILIEEVYFGIAAPLIEKLKT